MSKKQFIYIICSKTSQGKYEMYRIGTLVDGKLTELLPVFSSHAGDVTIKQELPVFEIGVVDEEVCSGDCIDTLQDFTLVGKDYHNFCVHLAEKCMYQALSTYITTTLNPYAIEFCPDGTSLHYTDWGSASKTALEAFKGAYTIDVRKQGVEDISDGTVVHLMKFVCNEAISLILDESVCKEFLNSYNIKNWGKPIGLKNWRKLACTDAVAEQICNAICEKKGILPMHKSDFTPAYPDDELQQGTAILVKKRGTDILLLAVSIQTLCVDIYVNEFTQEFVDTRILNVFKAGTRTIEEARR